ncbi:C-GCAxxG-C-C family (seleno)protein [Serpentinicella sp. ANB-PHB4]|uniref:C-GCAxxG-C-C family (seleno)protein n=1 Tax=Serpentinicella sp. ANB-PHB4 TaxID=3074076 RepID=UPI0028586026|nr:C-GCAxxG-C-C family (seleno)protein [Serpentinicella sp. ANB-PHB4]MDR5659314.1 C-GCAxxG-C-C family (seleno)protein [Serpentinicella sp. ANB-PHB4]
MLYELLKQGYGEDEDFNCAEKILYGANKSYNLGLEKEALKLSAGFGGGMGIQSVCGALTASVMVLSHLVVDDVAHESKKIKALSRNFLKSYTELMGEIDCRPLKIAYRNPEIKCNKVVFEAARLLDQTINEEKLI